MSAEFFLGSVALLCIAAYFAWRNNYIVSRRNAAIQFRSSFDIAYSINIFNSHDIDLFKTEFIRHKKAAAEFRNHLNWFSQHRFDNTLQNYEQWGDKILSASAHTGEGVYKLTLARKGRDVANEFKIHIDRLLSYAKYT